MFFVINKEKVYAYVVSLFTIVTLFFMSSVFKADLSEVEETGANVYENKSFQNDLVSNNEISEQNY